MDSIEAGNLPAALGALADFSSFLSGGVGDITAMLAADLGSLF